MTIYIVVSIIIIILGLLWYNWEGFTTTEIASNKIKVGASVLRNAYEQDVNTLQTKINDLNELLNVKPIEGWDFSGNDINNAVLNSPLECSKKCQNTDGCVGAVWSKAQTRCWTKHVLKGGAKIEDRTTLVMPDYTIPQEDNVYYYNEVGVVM